jgi:hypothetical protein
MDGALYMSGMTDGQIDSNTNRQMTVFILLIFWAHQSHAYQIKVCVRNLSYIE